MAHDIPVLARAFCRNLIDDADLHVDIGTETSAKAGLDVGDRSGVEIRVRDQLHLRHPTALLRYLERSDTELFPQYIDQRQPMHHGAIGGDDEVSCPAVDLA